MIIEGPVFSCFHYFCSAMPLFISSLNSGSNGNCYYIGNSDEAVLVDAGISCREIEIRMQRQGLDIKKVKAVFISHEHTDHISGLRTISKKYQLPVYITPHTLKHSLIRVEKHLINSFTGMSPVSIGNLSVTAFRKSHDASDPHSFIISGDRVHVGVFTDIGFACKPLINYFRQCHAAFLETNYCEEMLMTGSYPKYLKKRISSRKGHLSNSQALELFVKYKGRHLSYLVLSHLSENNNNPEIVDKLFNEHAGSTKIVIASRYGETSVYCVEQAGHTRVLKHTGKNVTSRVQLKLFET